MRKVSIVVLLAVIISLIPPAGLCAYKENKTPSFAALNVCHINPAGNISNDMPFIYESPYRHYKAGFAFIYEGRRLAFVTFLGPFRAERPPES
jgi:hypothetical protein